MACQQWSPTLSENIIWGRIFLLIFLLRNSRKSILTLTLIYCFRLIDRCPNNLAWHKNNFFVCFLDYMKYSNLFFQTIIHNGWCNAAVLKLSNYCRGHKNFERYRSSRIWSLTHKIKGILSFAFNLFLVSYWLNSTNEIFFWGEICKNLKLQKCLKSRCRDASRHLRNTGAMDWYLNV